MQHGWEGDAALHDPWWFRDQETAHLTTSLQGLWFLEPLGMMRSTNSLDWPSNPRGAYLYSCEVSPLLCTLKGSNDYFEMWSHLEFDLWWFFSALTFSSTIKYRVRYQTKGLAHLLSSQFASIFFYI